MNLKIKTLLVNFFVIIFLLFITLLYVRFDNSFIKTEEGNKTYYLVDTMEKVILNQTEKEEIISYLYYVDIFNYDGITIDKYANIHISVSERHGRALGSLEIKGNYENQEIIENLFNEINMANTTLSKYSSTLTYTPSNHNMKDLYGRIYLDTKEFDIFLKEDILLNPEGLNFKLHNPMLHDALIKVNNKKINAIILNIILITTLEICILLILDFIIIKYYKKEKFIKQ